MDGKADENAKFKIDGSVEFGGKKVESKDEPKPLFGNPSGTAAVFGGQTVD